MGLYGGLPKDHKQYWICFNMTSRSTYITLLLICACMRCHAGDNSQETWQSAQDAYLQDEMEKAASLFEEFLLTHPESHTAMYNLANCYLQLGNTGKSILWYERALRLRPNDQDTRHNLSIANARRIEPVVEIRDFFLTRWMRTAAGVLSVKGWAILSLLFFWGGVVFFAKRLRVGIERKDRRVLFAIAVCFVLSILLGSQRYRDLRKDHIAIVLDQQIEVFIAPETGSKRVSNIHAGEKVVIIDSLDQFLKVRLANYEQGWISAETIERI